MQFISKLLLAFAAVGLRATHAQISPLGATISLGGVYYFVAPTPVAQLSLGKFKDAVISKSAGSYFPFTFVKDTGSTVGPGDLSALVANYSAADDVWSPSFLSG